MMYDYGYGELNNKLIELFHSPTPDFDGAERLIEQGADINADSPGNDDNVLSEILRFFIDSFRDQYACNSCESQYCSNCESALVRSAGAVIFDIIRFFLAHDFNLNKHDGRFGAQCLYSVLFSDCGRSMIDSTKILLDAGARNCPTCPNTENDETAMDYASEESCFCGSHLGDFYLANIYEAIYRIHLACENGKAYSGINSFEVAAGKKVLRVLADAKECHPFFFCLNLPGFNHENCFVSTLYFIYEDGVLVLDQYCSIWTDTVLPVTELLDVSHKFPCSVGYTLLDFELTGNTITEGITSYTRPIVTMAFDSGCKVRFTTNFGDVENGNRAAYFEIFK